MERFYEALDEHATHVGAIEFTPGWIADRLPAVDVLHVHWPEQVWGPKGRGLRTGAMRMELLSAYSRVLTEARRARKRIWWTVHNDQRHERHDLVDELGLQITAKLAELCIVHSREMGEKVRARFHPRGDIVVMPHGNYEGAYPSPRPAELVRAELGLRVDEPVVVLLGFLRKYKGADLVVEASRRLRRHVRVIVAGAVHRTYSDEALRTEARLRPGSFTYLAGALPEQQYADLMAASDAVLVPYTRVTGSGAAVAAWSFGRGVVASDQPFFREYLAGFPDAGELFPSEDPAALAAAIERYLAKPATVRNASARGLAASLDWHRCVEPLIAHLERRGW